MHILLDLGLSAQPFEIKGDARRGSDSDDRRARAQSYHARVRMPNHGCAAWVAIWLALNVIHKY
jgi:hypothetical protein